MPQPAYTQLVHGAMMISRWVRVAGPNAINLHSTDTAVSQRTSTIASHPIPALNGMAPCPDLGLPRPPASISTQIVSAQILSTLRANIIAQSDLQVDIFGVLNTMAARFEAAKIEMTAAQGLDWENDTWDFAAKHLKMKKARVQKWCDMLTMAAGEARSPLTDVNDGAYEGSRDDMNMLPGRTVDDFSWIDWDNIQWESALFDEMLQDIHS